MLLRELLGHLGSKLLYFSERNVSNEPIWRPVSRGSVCAGVCFTFHGKLAFDAVTIPAVSQAK